MLRPLEDLGRAIRNRDGNEDSSTSPGFGPLRLMTAQLLLMTAAEAVLGAMEKDPQLRPLDYARRARIADTAAGLAPSLLAPLAAAAHLAHVSKPSRTTDVATRVLDTAVVGIGVGSAIATLVSPGRRRAASSAAPLALATAGVLGLVLDRQERIHAREHRRLERRASVVERLVPARRPRLDHIVVHV